MCLLSAVKNIINAKDNQVNYVGVRYSNVPLMYSYMKLSCKHEMSSH